MEDKTIEGSPCGAACKFVLLNEEWGIKLYNIGYIRDECYEWQKKAAEHGLGPQVGQIVNLPPGKGSFIYGYITQVAETLCDPWLNNNAKSSAFWARRRAKEIEIADEMAELRLDLMNLINFNFVDDHVGNVGRINGKLVCIDFELR
jgi:hypothetical protein